MNVHASGYSNTCEDHVRHLHTVLFEIESDSKIETKRVEVVRFVPVMRIGVHDCNTVLCSLQQMFRYYVCVWKVDLSY